MYGAIIGDIVGSRFERFNKKSIDFELFHRQSCFTDDTVLTVAVADALLNKKDYVKTLQEYGRKYPDAGYGGSFYKWIYSENPQAYNSWGNGSAMRVSPVAYAFNSIEEVLQEAKKTAEISHNHHEGIKGAQAIAAAIFFARIGKTKQEIKDFIQSTFAYDLERSIDKIRPYYKFEVSCQNSVPEAIISFLESSDFETAIRLAISIGGDSDTLAAMAGSIAEAFYKKIPENIVENATKRLPKAFLDIIHRFRVKYQIDS